MSSSGSPTARGQAKGKARPATAGSLGRKQESVLLSGSPPRSEHSAAILARSKGAGFLPAVDQDALAVEDFLNVLEEHQRACERAGRYQEAESALQRLKELKLREEARRSDALQAQHTKEQLELEEAQIQELAELDAAWAQRTKNREEKELALIHAMEDKHQAELAEHSRQASLEPVRPKYSQEYLNLRKIERELAKLREYARAHEIKVKADEMEARENEQAAAAHMMRIRIEEERILKRQAAEMEARFSTQALHKRIEAWRLEADRARQGDLAMFQRRCATARTTLAAVQSKQRAGAEALWRTTLGVGRAPIPKAPDQPFSLLTSANGTKWQEITGKLDERLPVQKIPSPFRSKVQGARGARAGSASPGGAGSGPGSVRRGSIGSAGQSPMTPRVGRQGSGGGSYAQKALAAGGYGGAGMGGGAGGEADQGANGMGAPASA